MDHDIYWALPAPTFKEYGRFSVEMPGTRKPGQTGHYRSPKWTDLQGEYGRPTLPDLFESALAQGVDRPMLGRREVLSTDPLQLADHYTWETGGQVDKRRRALGSAIEKLFRSGELKAGADFEGVGVWSINRPEWQILDLACMAYNKACIALYDTLGPDAVEYIINHSELPIVFCTENHIDALLALATKCPGIKMVVSFDSLSKEKKQEYVDKGQQCGIEVREMSELEEGGAASPLEPIPATVDQIATVCYTSGTTGTPKGVVLTHKNIGAAVLSYSHGAPVLPRDFVFFSYLPMAHVYGRCFEISLISLGGRIAYYSGNPLNLLNDMQIAKPHFLAAVPRVLNRIYASAMATARAPGLKGYLFRWAVASKVANFRQTGVTTHWFWDRLIFSKVQAAIGGRVTVISSGGAPINPDIMDFCKIAFVCEVLEGYGLTETTACGARTWPDDPQATGNSGGVMPHNEMKLIDVLELSYYTSDQPNPRGEVCFRGDNVFSRYYKDDEMTKAVIDEEGWFHSGDVAEIDAQGRFKVIDRIKNIMKLSQGEYVAVEKVENVYTAVPVVAQVFVYGDSLKDHLVAVVVPDVDVLASMAKSEAINIDPKSEASVNEALNDPAVKKLVLDALTVEGKKGGQLKGFEMVKAVHLTMKQFTMENDTLTPTFKIKRRQAYQFHNADIDALYQ